MASHMRISDQSQNDFSSEIIDEDVRIEAQDVRSSRKYFYTPERGKAKRVKQASRRHHHSRRRKSHKGLWITLVALVVLLTAAAVVAGFYGRQLKASARNVKAQASTALEQVNDYKTSLMAGDYATAQASAEQMASIASEMRAETDGTLWRLASRVPVYGSDVQKVRTLASVFEDLSQNALIPITQELSGLSFSAIVGSEGNIDVDTLVGLVNALSSVSDVINRNAATVDALGEAKLDQVNGPLQKVRSMLSDLDDMTQGALKIAPILPQMLGANGQTKHYIVVAQNNAEIRATGGFPGSWGLLSVTDGKLELGDFSSFAGIRPNEGYRPTPTDDEVRLFGANYVHSPGNANIMPDWPRAGELFSFYHGVIYDYLDPVEIDGVVGIDPVFLQLVLKYTGGVTVQGIEVNGDNAAEVLLHDVYLTFEKNADQDAFFAEVAQVAFKQFTSNIGGVGLENVMKLLQEGGSGRRFQVWMKDEAAEAIMVDLGIAGELVYDPTQPVLGVYTNDNTWAKICWYLKLGTQVGEATINGDGSKTYHVTTTLTNTMTADELYYSTRFVYGVGPERRGDGDLVTGVLLYAPAGGTISNVEFSDNCNVHGHFEASYNGLQVVSAHVNTYYGETTTITYTVTTAPQAVGDLQVRMTPTGQPYDE